MRGASRAVVLGVVAAFAAGCASSGRSDSAPEPTANPFSSVQEAIASVGPVGGKGGVHGVVQFTQVDGGVRVRAEIEGFQPNSKHAFHVHEWGDATCADGKCAGGHFNPENVAHGSPDAAVHHAGDLGNLDADGKGVARLDRVFQGLTVAGEHDALLGRSVIIHAGADDFTTQPAGIAGDGATRIACGVIGIAKPAGK